jgi:hypothetical protein
VASWAMTEAARPNAREVHSVLAAAMADPHLLESWRREPSSLDASGGGAVSLDLAKIRHFSGLVTKVRYSDLRSNLPVTFRILDSAGLSIELFAAYARTAASLRNSGRNSKSAKLDSLVRFLDGRLDRTNRVHELVWDLIRHESAIFHLQEHARSVVSHPDPGAVSTHSVATRPAGTIFHELKCNPVEAAKIIRAGGDPASVAREPCVVGYRRSEDGTRIEVTELDELAAFLIDNADGTRTVDELAELLQQCGIALEPEDLLDYIRQSVAAGLLTIVHTGA